MVNTFNETIRNPNSKARFERFMTEFFFLCPNIAFINVFTSLEDHKAYVYQFNSKSNFVSKIVEWTEGALHHEEIDYIFGKPFTHSTEYTNQQKMLAHELISRWIRFIKTG